ncbi:fibronectin type III domain-containing protein [Planomonospora algeriensis]
MTDDTVMRIGGIGTDKTAAVIGFKLDGLPNGAAISEGILKLGTPACPAGTCPSDAVITATPLKSPVTGESKGSELAGDADTTVSPLTLPLSGLQADIAGSEYQWLLLTSNKDEVITFADPAGAEQPSLALTYLPAGPPSKVLNLTASGGDAGAIASWGLPESSGSVALLDGYDVEVTDSGGAVVKTLDVADPYATITGLANDQTYTIKVRAKTAFGTSGWESTTVITKAVPPPSTNGAGWNCAPDGPSGQAVMASSSAESGAQAYIDQVKAQGPGEFVN